MGRASGGPEGAPQARFVTVFVELCVVASFLTPNILFALVCLLTAKEETPGTSPTRVLSCPVSISCVRLVVCCTLWGCRRVPCRISPAESGVVPPRFYVLCRLSPLRPAFLLWLILRVVFPSVEDCLVFCVWGLCLPFSSLRQWAVDVLRLSGVRLLSHFTFMVACPSRFTPVSCCVCLPPSARTSCPRTGGCWRLSVWFGCASHCICRCSSLHPVRRSVLFLHAVWFRAVLPWTWVRR